jgi:uncharacterized protein (UPF0276 family)
MVHVPITCHGIPFMLGEAQEIDVRDRRVRVGEVVSQINVMKE